MTNERERGWAKQKIEIAYISDKSINTIDLK